MDIFDYLNEDIFQLTDLEATRQGETINNEINETTEVDDENIDVNETTDNENILQFLKLQNPEEGLNYTFLHNSESNSTKDTLLANTNANINQEKQHNVKINPKRIGLKRRKSNPFYTPAQHVMTLYEREKKQATTHTYSQHIDSAGPLKELDMNANTGMIQFENR
ncbi:hypothetical protein KAFR_0D01050 [Kazachstania africana CBS 2517]|uniref:Uncharacterized protein n=1 Tax=Kazachstania africana (strain ATCC 22294 / BCRC 22015 / CBS 2517 / CECT 1963 / NBRC 1671 / NRRL Y-8276) TaxID=1071382 RepID=H2ATQ1_KAZAF|nr:hypothetical protein KAFR_0D01050 [Kazachstania africana CBS 2517]CCF57751.1 hypothetical protein KAFR_0D01050 [Kazachstania africana CBS 2517]